MREHLFKGISLGDKTWARGDLIHDVLGIFISGYDENFEWTGDYKVDPDTVCEYTGQLDRDGMKIFEHDVMKFTNEDGEESFYRVEWRENRFIVADVENSNAVDDLDRFFCDSAIVVGNKFDGWKQEEKK